MVHDDLRSGERTLHTVAIAITIFIFLLLDLLTRPLTITQVVFMSVYNIQIFFHDARLEASWRLCLVAYLRTPLIQPPIAGSPVQTTGFAVLFLTPVP